MTTSTSTTSSTGKRSKQQEAPPPLALASGKAPDFDIMKKAAEVHGLKVPAGTGESATRELLGILRTRMAELNEGVDDDQQLQCHKCGERSTEHTEFCPFCGDLGIAPDGAEPPPAQAATISKLPEAAPKRDTEAAMVELGKTLDAALEELNRLKQSIVDSSYDMGVVIQRIHDQQLFKARGFDSFKQFADSNELSVSRGTAYQLMGLVEKFTREDYQTLGYRKLRTIGLLDAGDRKAAVDEAKQGKSVREVDETVRAKRESAEKPRAGAPGVRAGAPPKGSKVTVLAKVDAKPRELRFKSAKSGTSLASAAKVSQVVADAYAEVELDGGVFLRIGLRVSGKDLVGLSAEFKRNTDLAAAQ